VRTKLVSILGANSLGIPGQQVLVYRKEDGVLINAEMLLHGDARFDRRYQGRSHDLLAQAEKQARKARVGCWARAADLDALVAAYRNLSSTNEKAK
jgi:endonuclease YncB( thermonuclease family)